MALERRLSSRMPIVATLASWNELVQIVDSSSVVVVLFHENSCPLGPRLSKQMRRMATQADASDTTKYARLEVSSIKGGQLKALGIEQVPWVQVYRKSDCVASLKGATFLGLSSLEGLPSLSTEARILNRATRSRSAAAPKKAQVHTLSSEAQLEEWVKNSPTANPTQLVLCYNPSRWRTAPQQWKKLAGTSPYPLARLVTSNECRIRVYFQGDLVQAVDVRSHELVPQVQALWEALLLAECESSEESRGTTNKNCASGVHNRRGCLSC